MTRTADSTTFRRLGLGVETVDYHRAWDLQRELHAARLADTESDIVLLLEHPPVYTAGKRTEPHERPVDGAPVIDVDRGGKITFHGPGQLVGYPIVALPDQVYVVDYVRRLEEALIRACGDFGVATGRVKGRSGVWIAADDRGPERKVAALGIRVSGGVTMHGFALNCDPDLTWFVAIVPCATRIPIAASLRSRPRASAGTQTPLRPSTRPVLTPSSPATPISACSSRRT